VDSRGGGITTGGGIEAGISVGRSEAEVFGPPGCPTPGAERGSLIAGVGAAGAVAITTEAIGAADSPGISGRSDGVARGWRIS